jgi:hypothetical protein
MLNSIWRDGYVNDSFLSGTTWHDGQFYGTEFWSGSPTSKWLGGIFHYGYLDGIYYTQAPNTKWSAQYNQIAQPPSSF